jgi:pimeloyl-ACP methyl ester carboxylesterase
MQPVRFTNHMNEKLSGTLHRPINDDVQANGFGFILGHCFTCSRHTRILIDLSNALTDLGFCVLRFDFSGNGQSEGSFEDSTYTKQIDEMISAAAYMKKNEADHVLIGGHSMGGMVSLFTAARQKDIAGVISLAVGSAPLHPDRLLTDIQKAQLISSGNVSFSSRGRNLVLTRNFFDDAEQYDVQEMIAQITCPVLIVSAENDMITDSIPPKFVLNSTNQNVDLFEVKGADHMFSSEEHRQTVISHVTQWIKINLIRR